MGSVVVPKSCPCFCPTEWVSFLPEIEAQLHADVTQESADTERTQALAP